MVVALGLRLGLLLGNCGVWLVNGYAPVSVLISPFSLNGMGIATTSGLVSGVLDLVMHIMKSLVDTIRLVALRKNAVKLQLYRHFRNTLLFAVIGQLPL